MKTNFCLGRWSRWGDSPTYNRWPWLGLVCDLSLLRLQTPTALYGITGLFWIAISIVTSRQSSGCMSRCSSWELGGSINRKLSVTVVGRRIRIIVEQSSGDGRRWPVRVSLRLRQPQLVLVHERGLLARPLGLRHRRPPVRTTGRRRVGRSGGRLVLWRRYTTTGPPLMACATRLWKGTTKYYITNIK